MSATQYRKELLEKINHALDLQDSIVKCVGVQPQLRLYNNGQVVLQMDMHHGANEQTKTHQLCKLLNVRFDKTTSTQGFLKLVAFKDNVQITIHTRSCFFGGDPIVTSRPRTIAKCPIKKERT